MKRIFKKLIGLSIVFTAGWYANQYYPTKAPNTFTIERSGHCLESDKERINVARIEALIKRSQKVQDRIFKKLRKGKKA